MASGHEMRAGHAEREAVAAELREHYASGRLTLDELNERLDKTFAAKTRGDLEELMRDLPAGQFAAGGMGGSGGAGGPAGWGTAGSGAGRGAAQAIGASVFGLFLIAVLLLVGWLGVFGIGASRPFGIVLIIAALAFLRRLIFRRRGFRACGPRRRRW